MDVIPTTDALDQPTVMTQIRKLVEITDENIAEFADTINEGTYKSVSMTGPVNGKYTFNFVNQNDETESFEFLVKDIKTVASSQSGSTVTLTVTYSNNTTQTFTWTAGGDVTTNTTQTISAVKTFTASPIVPDTPSGVHASVNQAYVESTVDGVNNLLHKSGNETKSGWLNTMVRSGSLSRDMGYHKILTFTNRTNTKYIGLLVSDRYNTALVRLTISEDFTAEIPTFTVTTSTNYPEGNHTKIGVGYDSDNDEYFLFMNHTNGSNMATNFICLIFQVGTIYNSTFIFKDEIIDEPLIKSEEAFII